MKTAGVLYNRNRGWTPITLHASQLREQSSSVWANVEVTLKIQSEHADAGHKKTPTCSEKLDLKMALVVQC